MAYTYIELQAEVKRWLSINNDPDFDASFPGFVRQAEERIYGAARIQPFRQEAFGLTHFGGFVYMAENFVSPLSVVMTSLGGEVTSTPLIQKQTDYLRELYVAGETGTPIFYAMVTIPLNPDAIALQLGPAPSSDFATFDVSYYGKPVSLVNTDDPGTTWVSRNAETTLLQGTLYYAYLYEKGEGDMLKQYQDEFDKGLLLLKGTAQTLLRRDEYRASPQAAQE